MPIDVSFDFDGDEPPRDLTPQALADIVIGERVAEAIELPETWTRPCRLCGKPLTGHFWHWNYKKWYGQTCHERCITGWDARRAGEKPFRPEIPERFAAFDIGKFRYPDAADEASAFGPDSKLKALALIGPVGRGKSRLMWQVISQFFTLWAQERGQSRWVDAYLFSDLVTEYDQSALNKLKHAQFVLVDDIGDLPAGRARSSLQEVIRNRVKTGRWTFLTIDDTKFDPDLVKHIFVERGVAVMVGD